MTKQTKRRLLVVFSVIIFVSGILGRLFYYSTLEEIEKQTYVSRQTAYKVLKSISKEFIHQGKGIYIQNFGNELIKYNVYPDKDNIIFRYSVVYDSIQYEAIVTLSKDYEVLKEEYSIEEQTFEEYQKTSFMNKGILSTVYGAVIGFLLCGLISGIIEFVLTIKSIKFYE